MARAALAIEGGFDDPVLGSQSLFRAIMDALARPGTIQPLGVLPVPPAPLAPELGGAAAVLADHDTSLWLDPGLRHSSTVVDWLGFHTGALVVDDPAAATFALASANQVLPALSDFAQGTDEYPDRSTTLILTIEALEGGPRLTLRGPGIDGETVVTPRGLPQGFVRQWHDNRARFPRGVDVLLVAGGSLIGLPRTTRIATELV
jgi:alpha-D-ribose 1-methylphosphonate 5-triphosphate synthase subunit PhnH